MSAPATETRAAPPAEYDCRSCGACCRASLLVQARGSGMTAEERAKHTTTEADLVRRGIVVGRKKGKPGRTRYMDVRRDASCSALVRHRSGSYSCGVYSRRPEVCRVFEPGNWICVASRIAAGVEKEDRDGHTIQARSTAETIRNNVRWAEKAAPRGGRLSV